MEKKLIYFIHGARSTPATFSFLKSRLPEHDNVDIAYTVQDSVQSTIDRVVESARTEARPINIIAHSLGGVIAAHVAQSGVDVDRVVTMSSPFGGSRVADIMRWWYPCQLFDDIGTSSPIIRKLTTSSINVPMLSIVTTGGPTPLMREANDGVVSVSSQMALSGPLYRKLPYNHFEILLTDESARHITDYVFRTVH